MNEYNEQLLIIEKQKVKMLFIEILFLKWHKCICTFSHCICIFIWVYGCVFMALYWFVTITSYKFWTLPTLLVVLLLLLLWTLLKLL